MSADGFNPYHEWLGIPLGESIDHYRLLGVPRFETNPKVIENAYEAKMAFLRTKQLGPQAQLSQRVQSELTVAQRVLLAPEERAAYDAGLRRSLPPPAVAPKPQPVVAPQPVTMPKPLAQVKPITVQTAAAVAPQPVIATKAKTTSRGAKRGSNHFVMAAAIVGGLLMVGVVLLSTQGEGSPEQVANKPDPKPAPAQLKPTPPPPPKKPLETRSASRIAIDAAVAQHTKQMSAARTEMETAFATAIDNARKDATLSGDDKLNLVARLEVEKKAFDKAGYVPFSAVMRDKTPIYIKQITDADKQLRDAFEKEINAAVTAANDKEADQFKQERDQRLKRRVIAVWSDWTMYADGQMHHQRWTGNHWALRGNRIDLSGGDRWTLSKLGDKVDCVNKFNIRFGLAWTPPP